MSALFDYLIVGAGFAGSVLAERLATRLNAKILLIDRRSHIGGNAYDEYNEHGVLIHRYGPHIFHTNSQTVMGYLSRFTQWREYEHRVLTHVDGQLLPFPINVDTLNRFFGINLIPEEVGAFLSTLAEPRTKVENSEDALISRIGPVLYENFFKNYTIKQWGLQPRELDASVAARIPVRDTNDDRYFADKYQLMPREGYTCLFARILDHPNISISLNTDYSVVRHETSYRQIIFTGAIDEFFDHRFGVLPYRSLRFVNVTIDKEVFQPAAVVNYPNEKEYTRITEFKYLTGQKLPKTTVAYEYPSACGDPFYPIPQASSKTLYDRYNSLAQSMTNVLFAGRLGSYRYFNMDQVVAQALTLSQKIVKGAQS